MPNVHFSFRRGAGDVPEILYGKVEIKPTLAFARGTSLVLPAPTSLDLVNGEATANNVYPTPAPVAGQVEWAYRVKAIDTRGQSFEWMVGVPDSTGTVEFTSLPRYFETKPPLFGKGEKGDPGEAATIQIGTATSGATPSVTNSGTNQNAVLDFVLPKGDKGDKGDGVPDGGSALQYIRKDASGTFTEWASLINATAVSDGLMPAGDKDKLDKATFSSTANTIAVRNSLGQLASQDPTEATHTANQRYVIGRTNAEIGGSMDLRTSELVGESASSLRSAIGQVFVDRHRSDSGRIALGIGALASLPDSYNLSSNATIVSLGYNAHGNMTEVRQSIAIGAGAMSQGTKSRDNIAIGDDSGWATQSFSALYDQNNREGTRNVMIGGLSGRFNKSGIGHVLIGRGAGASIVSGRGAVIIGSNAHVSSQPIGLSGEIENWAKAFAGNPESRALVVAIGESSLSQNVGKNNTAIGASTLEFNTTGQYNTAIGVNSLSTVGSDTWYNGGLQKTLINKDGTYTQNGNQLVITATGHGAVSGDIARFRLIGGESSTFAGDYAYAEITSVTANSYTVTHPVSRNTSGTSITSTIITGTPKAPSQYNTGVGGNTLTSLLTGSNNTALGYSAGNNLVTGSDNTFFGYNSGGRLVTGSRNMNFGFQSGNFLTDDSAATAVDNSITIGPYARVSGSNEVQIGTSAQTVYTYNAVQTRSDLRDKREVRDSVLGLDFINALRPVDYKTAFRDNAPGDSGLGNRYHHGFIAQEMLKFKDFGGVQDHKINGGADVLTVAYSELIAPIVKAIQELSNRLDCLEKYDSL